MSRTCHSTSVRTMILRENQEKRRSQIKEKVLNVMDVMVLVTLDQNVPRTSKNKRRACLFLGMMMILKVNLMMKLPSMLQPSLVDMNLMKIPVMWRSLKKNWLFPTKSFVLEVNRFVR